MTQEIQNFTIDALLIPLKSKYEKIDECRLQEQFVTNNSNSILSKKKK